MPPVMAMRDLRVLSSPPQVVHFIPMQATPRPATVTIMLTIMRARVAWRAPSVWGQNTVNSSGVQGVAKGDGLHNSEMKTTTTTTKNLNRNLR